MKFRSPLRFLTALLLLAASVPTHAKLFIIFDTTDSTNVTSLRGAILEANRRPGHHDIILVKTNYQLSLSGPFEQAARTGDLDITGSITITGTSAHGSTIDATGLGDRLFEVHSRAQLNLQNITLTGGTGAARYLFTVRPSDGARLYSTTDLGCGGAIYNVGVLTLKRCRIFGNVAPDATTSEFGYGADGGAIYSGHTLLMEDCIVAGNHTGRGIRGSGNGGGVLNYALATLNRCTLIQNLCGSGIPDYSLPFTMANGGGGGGIFNYGKMILNNSAITRNATGNGSPGSDSGAYGGPFSFGGSGGYGGDGGGIYNGGTLTVNRCTISSNTTGNGGPGAASYFGGPGGWGGNGGGIFNSGNLTLNTSTLSGNTNGNGANGGASFPFPTAAGGNGGNGGGLFNQGKAQLTSATICLNLAGEAGNSPSAQGKGGGICNSDNTDRDPTVILRNSLVSLNAAAAAGFAQEVSGEFISQGYNLISASDGSSGLVDGIHHDLVGSEAFYLDPLLAPLNNNGGRTSTHALLPGSPAIDQGKHFDSTTDQRGKKRPYNFPNIPNATGGDATDIGAFELTP